jgi:hypothetical protein
MPMPKRRKGENEQTLLAEIAAAKAELEELKADSGSVPAEFATEMIQRKFELAEAQVRVAVEAMGAAEAARGYARAVTVLVDLVGTERALELLRGAPFEQDDLDKAQRG